jgi:hypothetical protein
MGLLKGSKFKVQNPRNIKIPNSGIKGEALGVWD